MTLITFRDYLLLHEASLQELGAASGFYAPHGKQLDGTPLDVLEKVLQIEQNDWDIRDFDQSYYIRQWVSQDGTEADAAWLKSRQGDPLTVDDLDAARKIRFNTWFKKPSGGVDLAKRRLPNIFASPPYMSLKFQGRVPVESWLVRFGGKGRAIKVAQQGFLHGTSISRLAVTRNPGERTLPGPYNFAYELAGHEEKHSFEKSQYGNEAVLFKCTEPAIRIYHEGDKEHQIIFDGGQTGIRVPIIRDDDSRQYAIYRDRSGMVSDDGVKVAQGSLTQLGRWLDEHKVTDQVSLDRAVKGAKAVGAGRYFGSKDWAEHGSEILKSGSAVDLVRYADELGQPLPPEAEKRLLAMCGDHHEQRDGPLAKYSVAVAYAARLYKGKGWRDLENDIINKRRGQYVISYAREVLRKPWEAGSELLLGMAREEITKMPNYITSSGPTGWGANYAVEILKTRWPAFEKELERLFEIYPSAMPLYNYYEKFPEAKPVAATTS